MSEDRKSRSTDSTASAPSPAPGDRLGSIAPEEIQDNVPAVYGVATPGGGRRGFLKALSHGVVAAGSAAALTSCGGDGDGGSPSSPSPAASTYTLSGSVTASSGGAISGATVEVLDGSNAGKSTTTSSSGSYSLTGLVSGGFTVRVSASGYTPMTRGISLTSNSTQNFSLSVVAQATFTMAGVVSNKNTGRGIGNATVRVLDGPNAGKSDGSDGNGYYSVPSLVRGGFTAQASASGFQSLEKPVGIDGDTRVDFQLTPVSGSPCSCEPVCTCDTVCTCNPVCSCVSYSSCSCQSYGHYWYPS